MRYFVGGVGNAILGSTVLSQDTWYHVALVRNSGTTTIYLDGTSEGTYTDTQNYNNKKSNNGVNCTEQKLKLVRLWQKLYSVCRIEGVKLLSKPCSVEELAVDIICNLRNCVIFGISFCTHHF